MNTTYALPNARRQAITFVSGDGCYLFDNAGKRYLDLVSGLGVNALVAVTAATNKDLRWPDVMGLVLIAGLVMLVLVLTGFRTRIFKAVPAALKYAVGAGIGLFLVIIGPAMMPSMVTVAPTMPDAMPKVIGGRYGLSSKEFTPAMVKAVFDALREPAFRLKHRPEPAAPWPSRARGRRAARAVRVVPPRPRPRGRMTRAAR